MVHPFLENDVWCYWLVSAGALLSFVGLVVACICSCRRNENKSEFLGLAGMVTITHSDSEGFNRLPTSDVSQLVSQDSTDAGKRSTSSANRSLPDIPKDRSANQENRITSNPQDAIYEVTETAGDPLELYATVKEKGDARKTEQEAQDTSQESTLLQNDSVSPYARLKSPDRSNDEHPYAQLQNIQKTDGDQPTRSTATHAMDSNKPSTSNSQPSVNPVAPPRTRKSSSQNSLLTVEPVSDIQAATAISGGVHANQDLPYMTPPILMPLPQPPQPQHGSSPQQHFSGDSQDSKGYTSISVREPLANILAQTKAAHQQRHATRALTDPHYATVSDDSDEMYAAIDEQEKVYTSGSETYAQIQPMTADPVRVVQTEHPSTSQPLRVDESHVAAPQPPSVDSLRHVAHAHSRQASSSSATSSVANLGSPKPEKRQANSPLPPPPEGTSDMYALIDKRKTDDRSRSSVSSGKSLEDMYAKVIKKKKELEDGTLDGQTSTSTTSSTDVSSFPCRKLSLVEISRASWSSHDSVEIQKREPEPLQHSNALSSQGVAGVEVVDQDQPAAPRKCDLTARRLSLELDHGYEAVSSSRMSIPITRSISRNDPNYEVLRPQYSKDEHQVGSSAARNGDLLAMYSTSLKHRQTSNASSEDPGYERVRLRRRVDLDLDTDSEPNYESMPHDPGEPNYASVCRPGDSDTDPNYESVSHGDPNYESVKYMSLAQTEDPPYEQVNSYKPDNPDGYEKVKRARNVDPDYEKINRNYVEKKVDNGDTDEEQYVQV
ncbi:uncharacterized protein LOC105694832 [Orussus abietinus]|uniref:uncharacterized protein LOC105694832 n=1 Tax=Orussus abietinus TaxID=222816 RepID=UPI00062504BC|nr:uncharacterized protein LOC105694832 [Orussus abietinus]XP_012271305.1 uncharacterized protein LOC105694832 [Orussus abietinus]